MIEEQELLPCPFCGEPAFMHEGDTKGQSFYVVCSNCQAEGPFEDSSNQDDIPRARKDAADMWNKRVK